MDNINDEIKSSIERDFELDDEVELDDDVKELMCLEEKYKKMGGKEFTTVFMDIEEQIEIYKECIKQKKSYEKVYGKEKIKWYYDI